eukprot:534789-Amphidinium_carterae.1
MVRVTCAPEKPVLKGLSRWFSCISLQCRQSQVSFQRLREEESPELLNHRSILHAYYLPPSPCRVGVGCSCHAHVWASPMLQTMCPGVTIRHI